MICTANSRDRARCPDWKENRKVSSLIEHCQDSSAYWWAIYTSQPFRLSFLVTSRGGVGMAIFSLLKRTNHTNLYKNLIKI